MCGAGRRAVVHAAQILGARAAERPAYRSEMTGELAAALEARESHRLAEDSLVRKALI
jgi:hypothetical protein